MSAKEMSERSRVGREKWLSEIVKLIRMCIETQAELGQNKCVLAAYSYTNNHGLTASIPDESSVFRDLLKFNEQIAFTDSEGGRFIKSHFENDGYTFLSYYDNSKHSIFFTINW